MSIGGPRRSLYCRKCGNEHNGRTVDGMCLYCVENELRKLRKRVKEYEQREEACYDRRVLDGRWAMSDGESQ